MPSGQHKRPRATLGLDENVREEIETWASKEHRTLANFLEHMVLESYERRKKLPSLEKFILAANKIGVDAETALKLRELI